MSYQPSSTGMTPTMPNRFRKPITWANVSDPANDTWSSPSATGSSGSLTTNQSRLSEMLGMIGQDGGQVSRAGRNDDAANYQEPATPDVRSRYNLDGGSDSTSWFQQAQKDASNRANGIRMPQGNAQQRWQQGDKNPDGTPTISPQRRSYWATGRIDASAAPDSRAPAPVKFNNSPSEWTAY